MSEKMAGLIGVVILAVLGDRGLFYQDPYTYKAGHTKLTPLGEAQELQLGAFLRNEYLNPNSPTAIRGLSTELVDDRQLHVRADNGGERGAIGNSAVALLQGLFPPTPRSRAYLANGTTVVGPFGGYQYVPIESVEPEQSIQLEGWTKCPAFEKHIKHFYDSEEFKQAKKDSHPFLNELNAYLYGLPNNLENMWNIYDFVSVNYVHNETFAFRLPPTFLEQARHWANFHEHGIFTSKKGTGLGNIAGRTILPSIINYLQHIEEKNDPLHVAIQEISYKPLMSLFNLTGLDKTYPDLSGIPNYASALAFEVRLNDDGEAILRTKFKNGTSDAGFRTLRLFGHKEDIALNEFLYRLDLSAIHDTNEWCKTCGQTTERGCSICNTDFAPPTWPSAGRARFPTIAAGDEKEPINWSYLWSQLWDSYYFAVISGVVFFVLYGLVKLARSRRANRLQGYETLNTAPQYRDSEARTPSGKQRF